MIAQRIQARKYTVQLKKVAPMHLTLQFFSHFSRCEKKSYPRAMNIRSYIHAKNLYYTPDFFSVSYLLVHKCVLFVKLALLGSKLNLCI